MPANHGRAGTHVDTTRRGFLGLALGGAVALPGLSTLAGCGTGTPPGAVRVAYQQFGQDDLTGQWLDRTAPAFVGDNPGHSIEKVPIVASENDYFTKNELMMGSPGTSPDLVYEDTFILLSDVAAGYIQPVDDLVSGWSDWEKLAENSREAVKGEDGHFYAIPTHTDTRAIWYDTRVLSRIGIEGDWQPESWDDLLEAARSIKEQVPEVEVPFGFFSGKTQGEKASMQGFEMLLYGTDSRLYDEDQHKWVLGSPGFLASLEFIRTLFVEELTFSVGQASDPNLTEAAYGELMPAGKLGFLLDGSWISQNWIEGASAAWPQWSDELDVTRMPTRHGQGKGWVTLAGGWCWAIPQYSNDPKVAFDLVTHLMTKENVIKRAIEDQHISIRSDVSSDPEYRGYSPTTEFFTALVDEAFYRPALSAYPQVSSAIQQAMEDVMTQSLDPAAAAAEYDERVVRIVGEEKTMEAPS